jgi:DNA polymerase-3 subunit chi
MTRIDFYILPETAKPPEGRVMTACRLSDKATLGGQRVYIYAPEAADVDAIDGALWSFRQGSFVAHERAGTPLEEPLPAVLIGNSEPPPSHHQVLINLGNEVPAFFSRFERVLEIVDGDAAKRAESRVRFKFYRDRGYELNSHNLPENNA